MSESISASEARRIALAAQGFAGPKPKVQAGLANLRKVASRIHAFQIDPINVLVRAQYMPAYSRLGPYPVSRLDELAYHRRELFEYLGHQASLLRMDLYPLMRWRMEGFLRDRKWIRNVPDKYVDAVLEEVTARGPISASELSDKGKRTNGVWSFGHGKEVLAWLNASGQVAVAGRRGIEQTYDLTERVIPRGVLNQRVPSPDNAKKEMLVHAAAALGVGTAGDLANYFSFDATWWFSEKTVFPDNRRVPQLLGELAEEGRLAPVRVEGWRQPAYMNPDARAPRRIEARTLVSPFDPLLWERDRVERLFGFAYRIEIYVPEPQRKYGYYVLPFLMGDRLVARVDLKADRKRSVLVVPAAWGEAGVDRREVAGDLRVELRRLADWLGLERVEVGERGDLARELRDGSQRTPG